jgi:hypothetical protein
MASPPASMIMIEMTHAKMGLSMKNLATTTPRLL